MEKNRQVEFLKELKQATNRVINKAEKVRDKFVGEAFIGEAINWKSLSCIEAKHILNETGQEYYEVIIAEAHESCSKLHEFVAKELGRSGYGEVRILTEW